MRRDHTEVTDYESKLNPPIGIKGHIFIRIIHPNTLSCTPICGEEEWRLSESHLILTQLTPTVCHYLGQSYLQLTAGIQLIFHSLTSPPNGSTKNGKKTLRLLVLRQWGVFYFSFLFFFPYSVLEVTSFLTLLGEVPSVHLLWMDCITVVVTQYSNWVRHWRESRKTKTNQWDQTDELKRLFVPTS